MKKLTVVALACFFHLAADIAVAAPKPLKTPVPPKKKVTVPVVPAVVPATVQDIKFNGTYTLMWGGLDYKMTLSPNGDYTATGRNFTYIGGWAARGNSFWITESMDPSNNDSWVTYEVQLDPKKLTGNVVNQGFGVEVSIEQLPLPAVAKPKN